MNKKALKPIIISAIVIIIIAILTIAILKRTKTWTSWTKNNTENTSNWEPIITTEDLLKEWKINKWYCNNIKDEEEKKKCIEKMTWIQKQDLSTFTKAVQAVSGSMCDDIQNTNDKQWCLKEVSRITISNKAISSLNPELCEKLDDTQWKDDCLKIVNNWLIFKDAVKNKDTKKCNNISDEKLKNICIQQIKYWSLAEEAQKKWDISICNKIWDTNIKQSCIKDINNNNISQKAFADNDSSQCANIKDEPWKKKCEQEINDKKIIDEARQKKDKNICQKITWEAERNVCTNLATSDGKDTISEQAIAKNDPSLCDKYWNDPDKIIVCKAQASKNFENCSKIKDLSFQKKCYELEQNYKDELKRIKKEIQNQIIWEVWAKAAEKNDPSLCDKYKDDQTKYKYCLPIVNDIYYYNLAVKKWDVKICDNYTKELIPFCQAAVSKDKSYCDQLKDETDKTNCINSTK